MVATCYLLNQPMAFLAFLDVRSILPVFYLFLEGSLAAGFWVGFAVASVADLGRAFGTFARFFLRVCAYNY